MGRGTSSSPRERGGEGEESGRGDTDRYLSSSLSTAPLGAREETAAWAWEGGPVAASRWRREREQGLRA
jgi:hypothetical protein